MADSTITIQGGLGQDPEIRYTSNGQAKATLGVAVRRSWRNRQTNEWEERTSWINVVVWGDMAENVSDTLSKGMRIIATGRLEQRTWETEQGEKRSVTEMVADEIGPSLKWATADVKRSERRSGGASDGGGGGGGGRPAEPARVPDAGGTAEELGDEEPF
jgi:single-strand DNA-binding protein